MIDSETLGKVDAEDLDTLVSLDNQGFMVGADENGRDFRKRLQTFQKNLGEFEDDIDSKKGFQVDGLSFHRKDRIGKELFANAMAHTDELYGFKIDWVPGFFKNPRFSWLFGACAYSSVPDFFALFLIRNSFREKNTWLFYNRDELFAHELCHVARSGMNSKKYEEHFAYRTSEKKFRKVIGSILYSSMDTYLILAVVFLPLLSQWYFIQKGERPITWPFWLLIAGTLGFYWNRYRVVKKTVKSAEANLASYFGEENGQSVIFRCSDEEIDSLGKMSEDEAKKWIEDKVSSSLRWKVINHRFQTT